MKQNDKTKTELLDDLDKLNCEVEKLKKLKFSYKIQVENLERKIADIEFVKNVTNKIHQTNDLDLIFNTSISLINKLQNSPGPVLIYLVTKDRKQAVLNAYNNLDEDYLQNASVIDYPNGITWKVINSGQILNIEDTQENNEIGEAGKKLGLHRALGIPIILDGIVMGVIWMASLEKGQFNDREIELYVSIGKHIALAIAKAKLYDDMKHSLIAQNDELKELNIKLNDEIKQHLCTVGKLNISREYIDLEKSIKKILAEEKLIDIQKIDGNDSEIRDLKIASINSANQLLSSQELKVLRFLASGKSIKEIADKIYLSPSTVSTYRARILEKLNLKSTADLIRYAIENNLET